MVLTIILFLAFLLIILIKALNTNSKELDFEFSISIKSFKLSFKTYEKSTPSEQDNDLSPVK